MLACSCAINLDIRTVCRGCARDVDSAVDANAVNVEEEEKQRPKIASTARSREKEAAEDAGDVIVFQFSPLRGCERPSGHGESGHPKSDLYRAFTEKKF